MKRPILIYCGVIALSTFVCAQENLLPVAQSAGQMTVDAMKAPLTKLEKLLLAKGDVIIKEFIKLGGVSDSSGTAVFSAMTVSGRNQNDVIIKGIRVEVFRGYSTSSTGFLDLEEIDKVIASVDYMIKLAAEWKSIYNKPYTEVQYISAGEVKLGFYQELAKQQCFISCGNILSTSNSMKIEALPKIKEVLEKGKATLEK
jgi:hypothetical protein